MSSEQSSPRADASRGSRSVFDFLYIDARRIGSYLSQFEIGHLQSVVRTNETSETTNETSGRAFGLGIPAALRGDSQSSETEGVGKKDALQRSFDPYWSNARAILDFLNEEDLIERDLENAAVGSLVLVTGKLAVTDLNILKEMWKSPAMKKQILKGMTPASEREGNRHDRRSAAKTPKPDTSEQEAILEVLQHLPHTAQMNIVTNDYAVWSTIDEKSLVGTLSDLVLKHGSQVAGYWSMMGVLDARPFAEREDGQYDEFLNGMESIRLGETGDNIWKVARELAQPTREALGRPYMSYGMTPLMVFREIGRPQRMIEAAPGGGSATDEDVSVGG